ncbi:gliding motility ABC transporter [Leptospira gomenensis]|uniref:Gliding motility ABC transporter n=1 Tax=Leptospira gomenensis TaxID=2484974 RepID=A0A5F1YS33_9LEPT|nr:GldG family protein [Leptospira gomenensis]TGK38598.1 gliding motility ABC transporter [Leptospira gomenensis]TGK42835.1 gliding motility ABC transporter [Leptospira gomenensis]TGK49620.1 gliding motility ABC transporter [Leptospira gomenensis]TGK60710.1 gliding motility ABC transporter [Leptospira gomenensis]
MKEEWKIIREFFFRLNGNPRFLMFQWFLIFVWLNVAAERISCKKDLSSSGRFEISRSTERLLESLPANLHIDAYYSSQVPAEYKVRLDLVKDTLRSLVSVGGTKIVLRFYDPDRVETDRKKALEAGIEPQILERTQRGSAQVKQVFMGFTVSSGAKRETLPVEFYAEQIESHVLRAVKKIFRKPGETGIAILKNRGSFSVAAPGPQSGKDSIGILFHQIFPEEFGTLTEIDLEDGAVPDPVHTLLCVGTPFFSERSRYFLDQFLMRGGNLILLAKSMDFRLEPPLREHGIGATTEELKAGMARPVAEIEETNRVLENYGIRINTDLVFDLRHSLPMGPLLELEPGVIGRFPYAPWIVASSGNKMLNEKSPYTGPLKSLLLPWVSSLTFYPEKQPKVKTEILITSSEEAESRADFVALGEKQIHANPPKPEGEKKILGILLEGNFRSAYSNTQNEDNMAKTDPAFLAETPEGKTSRILAIGTPYLVSDLLVLPEFRDIFQESNIPFLLNIVDLVTGNRDLIEIRGKKSSIETLRPFTDSERIFLSYFHLLGIPLLLGLAAFYRIRKRNSYPNGGSVKP